MIVLVEVMNSLEDSLVRVCVWDLGMDIMVNSIVYFSFIDLVKIGAGDLIGFFEVDYDVVFMVKYLCGKFRNF